MKFLFIDFRFKFNRKEDDRYKHNKETLLLLLLTRIISFKLVPLQNSNLNNKSNR